MNLPIEHLHPIVLNVGLARHNADWNWPNVSSPFTRLYFVTEGEAQVELSDGTHDLKPEHMYIIPAFTRHTNICRGPFTHYYLHLYEGNHPEDLRLEQWDFPFGITAGQAERALFQRLCEIHPHMTLLKSNPATYDNRPTLMQSLQKNKEQAFYDQVESKGIVLQLLARFLKPARLKHTAKDERIEKATLYIRKHLDQAISLETLADQACLSKDHFIRLFKQEMNLTPLKYIQQKKVEQAQLLLATENLPVKEVAYRLGFDDYSYFNRLFKKMTGMTPQEYRRSNL